MARSFVRHLVGMLSPEGHHTLVADALVDVFTHGTTDELDVFAAQTGGAPLAQPLRSNALGEVEFWVESPDLVADLRMSSDGITTVAESGAPAAFATFTDPVSLAFPPGLLRPIELADYGPDPTGVADSSAAFIAAMADVFASMIDPDPVGTGAPVLRVNLRIGPGTYRITQPRAVMNVMGAGNKRLSGFIIEGAGMSVTQLIFDPLVADAAGPMMLNQDQFLQLTIRDLTFACTAGESDVVKPVWMDSYGTGGTKDVLLERVYFSGFWDRVISLRGDNTNAQFTFRNIYARRFSALNGFLHAASTSATAFVNYWFESCSMAIRGGSIVNAQGYLGHVHVNECMFLYEPGTGLGLATNNVDTLFRFRKNNVGSNDGFFSATNCYFELHEDGHKLLESRWQRGTIRLTSTAWSSGGPGTFGSASIAARIYNENSGIPAIVVDQCGMKGVWEFHYDSGAVSGPQRTVMVRRSELQGPANLAAMVTYVAEPVAPATPTTLHGGRPLVEFEECTRLTFANDHQIALSERVGWARSLGGGGPKLHRIKFGSPRGDMPRSTDSLTVQRTRRLPLGAVVVAAELYVSASGSTATDWSFAFATTELVPGPTPIVTITNNGAQIAAGLRNRVDGFSFVCDTDEKRNITVTPGGTVATGILGYLVLEYLA